jgi:hypothetical protein
MPTSPLQVIVTAKPGGVRPAKRRMQAAMALALGLP